MGRLWTPGNRRGPRRGKGWLDQDGTPINNLRRRCLGTRFGLRATGARRPADVRFVQEHYRHAFFPVGHMALFAALPADCAVGRRVGPVAAAAVKAIRAANISSRA